MTCISSYIAWSWNTRKTSTSQAAGYALWISKKGYIDIIVYSRWYEFVCICTIVERSAEFQTKQYEQFNTDFAFSVYHKILENTFLQLSEA